MTATFFFLTPMIYLSAFIFPIENMPQWIQYVTYAIPLRYFLVIVRGIFLKGVGVDVLWPQMAALLACGLPVLGFRPVRMLRPVVMAAVMSMVSVPALAQVDCILPRDVQSLNVPKSDPVYEAALKAEEIILKRGGFIAGLAEPVRLYISQVFENPSHPMAHPIGSWERPG